MAAIQIPVTFEYKGRTCRGSLNDALGAGNDVWFLMVENYYWGQLIWRRNFGLMEFSGNKPGLETQAGYFGDVITAWYQ
jgi:hypothetical protein